MLRFAAGLSFALFLTLSANPAMAIDLAPLWDFSKPADSEQRFRGAMQGASPDDALILQTQIARSYGLRKDFDQARAVLAGIAPSIALASDEARVRYWLELGRSYASGAHPTELQTPDNAALARDAYDRALTLAQAAQLDALAIDTIHMDAFVDRSPAAQLASTRRALVIARASPQADAKRWEATLLNNIGYALHEAGQDDEALPVFVEALSVRERGTNAGATRVAKWMVAMTLRSLGRVDEAIDRQLALEQECDTAGEPDPYVFEELETLYRLKGDESKAAMYARRRMALPG